MDQCLIDTNKNSDGVDEQKNNSNVYKTGYWNGTGEKILNS